jgi:hypothetical protein
MPDAAIDRDRVAWSVVPISRSRSLHEAIVDAFGSDLTGDPDEMFGSVGVPTRRSCPPHGSAKDIG